MSGTKQSISDKITNQVEENFRDPEIELQFIAYVLRKDPGMALQVKEYWFGTIFYKEIVKIIKEENIVFNQSVLKRELKNKGLIDDDSLWSDVLDELFEYDLSKIDKAIATKIMNQLLYLYESRYVLEGVGKILTSIKNFDLDKAKNRLKSLSRPISNINKSNEGFYINDYPERLEEIKSREEHLEESVNNSNTVGIPTGLYKFDKLCSGVLPGEFGLIIGASGLGKTVGLINFGISSWENGYNTFIASGEMSKHEMQYRIDANLSRIPSMKFRKASFDSNEYEQWDASIKKYEIINGETILYTAFLGRDMTIDNIKSIVMRLEDESGKKIQMLSLDYLNIMKTSKTVYGNNWERQVDVAWEIKEYATENELVIWSANQIIDDAYDKHHFTLKDIKYGRAIGEVSPIIIGILQDKDDLIAKRMRVQILKLRSIKWDTVREFAIYPNLDFMELDKYNSIGKHSLSSILPVGSTDTIQHRKKRKRLQ